MSNELFKVLDELSEQDKTEPTGYDYDKLNSEVQNLMQINNPQTRKVRSIAAVELIKEAVLTSV